ncbi:MAG: replication-associated recombination protein A [Planctomycetota bacterium]|jgi:putative ATPase
MSDLWAGARRRHREAAAPLAARLRPRTLEEFVGQAHLLGPGQLLPRMLAADRLTSVIFWGPPGTGKTALAELIARRTGRHFERAHAATIGVKDVRRLLAEATARLEAGDGGTILFLDEIHRFARNQQDVLLHDVEHGLVTLVGATTENPYFAVNSALVSRSTLLRFEPLGEADIARLVARALEDERGFAGRAITVEPEAVAHWARMCDGDARRALTALEVAVLSHPGDGPVTIDLACAEHSIQAKAAVYDGTGDEHYDVISAFIKSMRGSDPDAAVYWLARMLEAGEDPRFIARRLAIFASEDVGNADPRALDVAHAAWALTERIGLPECRLTLAQAAIYLAAAPKSNACTTALAAATREVREQRTVPVPKHLRDAHYRGAGELGHGDGYVYPHDAPGGHVEQEYLGVERVFYVPTKRGFEAGIRRRLIQLNPDRFEGESSPGAPRPDDDA